MAPPKGGENLVSHGGKGSVLKELNGPEGSSLFLGCGWVSSFAVLHTPSMEHGSPQHSTGVGPGLKPLKTAQNQILTLLPLS